MNEEKIWNFLFEKLNNAFGVAGLMGNLYVESKLNPLLLEGSYARKWGMTNEEYTSAVNDGTYDNFVHDQAGYGLAQWTYWSRKESLLNYAKSISRSIGDIDMQLDFLWDELQKYKTVINTLYSATSVREASDVVVLRYEKPQHTEEKFLANRANYGQEFYDKYGGNMSTTSVEKYCDGVESIYVEQPAYALGCDGSNGKCDCIGMCRGALKRAGVTGISNMGGTNAAARYCIQNLHKIKSTSELKVGDVVLKTRDKDDKNYPLPDKYRKGGSAYNGDLTNYTHIGTVTKVNPLEITHMTSPTAKKDTKIGNWVYVGQLPYVDYNGGGGVVETAKVYAASGSTVNMRAKPSTSSALVERIPVGTIVDVYEHGDEWSNISYKGKNGYIMNLFLIFDTPTPTPTPTETVTVSRAELETIYAMIGNMLGK